MCKIPKLCKFWVIYFVLLLSGTIYSQSIVSLPSGGIYLVNKDSNEVIFTPTVKLSWPVLDNLGFVAAAPATSSPNILATAIVRDGLNYKLAPTNLPINSEVFTNLKNSGSRIITTLNGDILLVGTNTSSVMKFGGLPVMDPPSVVVTPYPNGDYICALHRSETNQAIAIGGYCSIINKNTGVIVSDFPLPDFCASQLVSNMQWLGNRFVLCEKNLHSGIEFFIIDTKDKSVMDGNRGLVGKTYLSVNCIAIINSNVIFSYIDESQNIDIWKTIPFDQLSSIFKAL